jgi:putative tricarboxylic transport membrane protein
VNVPTLLELGVNVTAANWRGVFAAPGLNDGQKAKLVDLMTKMHASSAWKDVLAKRKWTDVFLAERPFEREIEKNIRDTEAVLKDLGLA